MELVRYTGSPYYPLPEDYVRLSPTLQKRARLNAIHLQETPDDLVVAWNFFCDYYLGRSKLSDNIHPKLDRNFFYKRRLPSPPLHNEIVRDVAIYPRTICGAPRSSAKSTVAGITLPLLLLLTRPHYTILSVLATDLLVRKRANIFIKQITKNPRIIADFGGLKPERGDDMWSRHVFGLTNGSSMTGISLGGKMLGERPDLILFDDPEYDPTGTTAGLADPERLAEKMETLLFDTLDPMLDEATEEGEAGCVLYWIGTLVHHKAYIHYAIHTKDDVRFTEFWNRRCHDAEHTMDGSPGLLWEAKWSKEHLAREMRRLGHRAYNLKFMNRPTSSQAALFPLKARHFYSVSGQPLFALGDPFSSDSVLRYIRTVHTPGKRSAAQETEIPAADWIARMYRLCVVDPSKKRTAKSDFACVLVLGFDQYNRMWVLDIHHAKKPGSEILDAMWDLAMKWRVHVCGIEDAGTQGELVERAQTDLRHKSLHHKHVPRITGVTYPAGLDKGQRIASALEWRFAQYWVLLPAGTENLQHWKPLYTQIRNFTTDMRMLQHDDAVDCLAMSQYVPGRGRGRPQHLERPTAQTPLEHIRAGEPVDKETGMCYLHGINYGDLTPADVELLRRLREEGGPELANDPFARDEVDPTRPLTESEMEGTLSWNP